MTRPIVSSKTDIQNGVTEYQLLELESKLLSMGIPEDELTQVINDTDCNGVPNYPHYVNAIGNTQEAYKVYCLARENDFTFKEMIPVIDLANEYGLSIPSVFEVYVELGIESRAFIEASIEELPRVEEICMCDYLAQAREAGEPVRTSVMNDLFGIYREDPTDSAHYHEHMFEQNFHLLID